MPSSPVADASLEGAAAALLTAAGITAVADDITVYDNSVVNLNNSYYALAGEVLATETGEEGVYEYSANTFEVVKLTGIADASDAADASVEAAA